MAGGGRLLGRGRPNRKQTRHKAVAAGAGTQSGSLTANGVATAGLSGFVTKPSGTLTAAGTGTATVTGSTGTVVIANGVATATVTPLVTHPFSVTANGVGTGAVSGFVKITVSVTAHGVGSAAVTALGSALTGVLAVHVFGSASITDQLQPPPPPTGLQVATASATQVNLNWVAATGATSYDVERDGVVVATVTSTFFFDVGLDPASLHAYRVRANA